MTNIKFFLNVLLLVSLCVHANSSDLSEGNLCQTHNKLLGECKLAPDCSWVRKEILARRMTFDDIVRCSWHGKIPVICCSITTLAEDNKVNPIPRETSITPQPKIVTYVDRPNKSITENVCEYYRNCDENDVWPQAVTWNILIGSAVENGEYPHMVAVGYQDVFNDTEFRCGGFIVSENYVLTAAHCCSDDTPNVVRFGSVDLDSNDYFEERTISNISTHPDYFESDKKNQHDIALLRLNEPIKFNSMVKPACLYTIENDLAENVNLTVTGWGKQNLTTNTISRKLLQTQLQPMALDQCNATITSLKYPNGTIIMALSAGHLCAYDPTNSGRDACEGDSGGPLQIEEDASISTVVGIISFGSGCGMPGLPGIYTRIASYREWIESIVWPFY